MKLTNSTADIFVPDGLDISDALVRTTHMIICAHQDDAEIMAYNGIAECFGKADKWLGCVVVADGAGSARSGVYADYTDEEMQQVRRQEQRKAAVVGEYGIQIQLDFPSSSIKDGQNSGPCNDLYNILRVAQPDILYVHNPADKHDTHVATMLRTIAAVRRLPQAQRPKKIYGCEVWRDLDWLNDADKQSLDCSSYMSLAASLLGVFSSQIIGGKRYDLATAGRRFANATYSSSHAVDTTEALTYAVDLTPLTDDSTSIEKLICDHIDNFKKDVSARIRSLA